MESSFGRLYDLFGACRRAGCHDPSAKLRDTWILFLGTLLPKKQLIVKVHHSKTPLWR